MKKLIILFLILSILVMGCSTNQDYGQSSPQQPQSESVGGGCGVAESENQETKIKNVGVEVGL